MADNDHLPPNSYNPARRGLGRPVDRRQESYEPSDHASRPIPPHGDVSREGDRIWPRPSMTSRVLIYGGAAIAAAAVTAGAVLATRKVADLVTGNDRLDREAEEEAEKARTRVYDDARGRSLAPGFAALPEREREAMRARARDRMREDEAKRSRLQAEARRAHEETRRPRRPRRPAKSASFLEDVEQTTQRLTRTANQVVTGVAAAVAGFRAVAAQAEGVMRDFNQAADQVRGFLDAGRGVDRATGTAPRPDPYRRPSRRDVVDLRETDETMEGPGEGLGDPGRTHRL